MIIFHDSLGLLGSASVLCWRSRAGWSRTASFVYLVAGSWLVRKRPQLGQLVSGPRDISSSICKPMLLSMVVQGSKEKQDQVAFKTLLPTVLIISHWLKQVTSLSLNLRGREITPFFDGEGFKTLFLQSTTVYSLDKITLNLPKWKICKPAPPAPSKSQSIMALGLKSMISRPTSSSHVDEAAWMQMMKSRPSWSRDLMN